MAFEEMKKIILALAMVACAATFTSCKKSCVCTTTQNMPGMGPMESTSEVTIQKGKCSDMNTTQTTNVYGETITQTVECVNA